MFCLNKHMYALVNCQIYTEKNILKDHAIIILNKKINAICSENSLPKKIKKIDLKKMIVSPGFIDLQINGCGGAKFNDSMKNLSLKTLNKMNLTNQRFGCTSFLPTLITSNNDLIFKAVDVMRNFLKKNKNQALGLHLEGPYINPLKKGIHNFSLIRSLTKNMLDFLCNNNDVIKKITLAPEVLNLKNIKKLSESGICVSIGHSNATYEESKKSFLFGVSFGTHLFNAMPPLIARQPGVIGAIFDTPKIYCSIIADGIHVNWVNMRLAKKIKRNRLILITDAIQMAGKNCIKNFVFSNKKIYCKNNLCMDSKGIIAGSMLTMIKAIYNSVKYANIALKEALKMATIYPAKAIKVDKYLGSIEVNKIANLVIFTEKYKIKKVVINGKIKNFN